MSKIILLILVFLSGIFLVAMIWQYSLMKSTDYKVCGAREFPPYVSMKCPTGYYCKKPKSVPNGTCIPYSAPILEKLGIANYRYYGSTILY